MKELILAQALLAATSTSGPADLPQSFWENGCASQQTMLQAMERDGFGPLITALNHNGNLSQIFVSKGNTYEDPEWAYVITKPDTADIAQQSCYILGGSEWHPPQALDPENNRNESGAADLLGGFADLPSFSSQLETSFCNSKDDVASWLLSEEPSHIWYSEGFDEFDEPADFYFIEGQSGWTLLKAMSFDTVLTHPSEQTSLDYCVIGYGDAVIEVNTDIEPARPSSQL